MDRIVVNVVTGEQTVVPWSQAEIDAFVAASIPTKDQLKSAAAAKRWQIETGGITLNGAPIRTDTESQTKVLGARVQAKEDAAYTLNWKTANGSFVTLDATTIIAIADAVRAHVQACFDAEMAVAAKITDDTYTTIAQVDAASEWPTV